MDTEDNNNTGSTSTFDFTQVQSLFCGSLDPLGIWKQNPPPPSGFLSEDGILRNGALMVGESLLQYTSAGDAVTTLFQAFQYGVKRQPEAPCLGKRKSPDSPYEWATYASVQTDATKIGSFLKAIGVTRGKRVGLSGKNAPEYLTAVQGCFWAGATAVPIYDTFGEIECKHIVRQAEIQVVFCSHGNLDQVLEWTEQFPSVKKIIVWGSDPVVLASRGQKVTSYEKCLEYDLEAEPSLPSPPKPEDLALIMYTSGTTGMPKGVMLPHAALVATIASIEKYFFVVGGAVHEEDIFMSYLPLAHVFDFFCECFFLFRGSKIGYYRGDQKTLVDDITELKPTIFVGVPRVFERIYKRVNAMVEDGSSMKKFLFQLFFDQKLAALKRGAKSDQASFLGDSLVFSKIKARLGGRVRLICSGGAPLPHHLEDWLKVTMCCPIVQGYGLTESCAASCLTVPDRSDQAGTVGPPLFSTEAKLIPVPDMGYDGSPEGGGEICLRGPSIMTGYYQNTEATAEVLTHDGWFHTGDIGKIINGGCVQIIDRKKQLFKLSQGEYVSPEKVEGIACKCALVGQIWVHGVSTEAFLVAVVVPSESAIEMYGGKDKAIQSEQLRKDILENLDQVCRAEQLKGYEIPKSIILHGDEWTPETGFVTPSFKLKRPTLWQHFSKDILALYAVLNSE